MFIGYEDLQAKYIVLDYEDMQRHMSEVDLDSLSNILNNFRLKMASVYREKEEKEGIFIPIKRYKVTVE